MVEVVEVVLKMSLDVLRALGYWFKSDLLLRCRSRVRYGVIWLNQAVEADQRRRGSGKSESDG